MSADADDVASEIQSRNQTTTTPEALAYSRQILDKTVKGGQNEGEQAIMDQYRGNNARAIQALRQAQQSIGQMQYNPQLAGLAVSAALAHPTRSGTTSESWGNAMDALHGAALEKQGFDLNRLQAELGYATQIPEKEQQYINAQMELQKLHEQQWGPLAKEALQVTGRQVLPGSGMISPNAKVAVSEGFAFGTPQFYARVRFLDQRDLANKAASSGTDTMPEGPDRSAVADQYGVPSTAPYPWTGMSTKDGRQERAKDTAAALKELQTDDAGVLANKRLLDDISRFQYLNKRTGTSPWQGVPGVHFVTGFGDDAKEMDKLTARMATLMRQPGWGRMTNYDLQLFQSATMGRDKSMATNDAIATALKAATQQQLEYNQFAHNYFAVHHTLQGARQAWDEYAEANKIFDPNAPEGAYRLNKNRMGYQDYFRQRNAMLRSGGGEDRGPDQGSQTYPDVTDEDRNDPVNQGLSDAEIHASKQPARARGGRIRGYAEGGRVQKADDYQATLEDLARALEQGSTFQWGDELNAAVHPGPYSSNVVQERGKQERFGASHPYSNFALEGAGGAASGLAAAKLGAMALDRMRGKAGALGSLASLISRYTPRSFVPKAALAGAGAGAISGAGSAQDVEHIPGMAAEQGAEGAIAGPLAGLVAKYGINGVMGLVDRVRGMRVPAANQKIIAALQSDKTTADEIRARLQRAHTAGVPSTTMADVGGPNLQALAQGVATKAGPDSPNINAYLETLQARQKGANSRVTDLVNRGLKPDDYQDKLTELTTNLYKNAKPLYDKAYAAFPKVKSDVIGDILGTKYGAKAGKQAYQYMQADGVPIGEVGPGGMIRKPSLQYLDYVKRGLDDQIESATRSGDTNLARILGGMKKRLVDELDTYTTDPKTGQSLYKAAREQYAGDAEVRNALTWGRDELFGGGGLTAREIQDRMGNMSYAERDAARTGAAEALFQQIGNTPYTSNAAQRIANIPNMRDKLGALFDKPSEYNTFMRGLQQEMENFQNAGRILNTGARSRAAAASADLEPTGHLGEAAYETALATAGHPLWAGARAAKWVGNNLMRPNTANAAADFLATQNNPAGRTSLDMLKQQAAQLQARQGTGDLGGLATATATGPMAAHDPWGNTEEPQ